MKKFRTSFTGYDRTEVNEFVNTMTNEYEVMLNNLKTKDKEIDELKEKLDKYQNMEMTLNKAILIAEDTSNRMKKLAENESSTILNDARKNASRIVNAALIKADKIDNDTLILKRKIENYKRRLRAEIENQLIMIDSMDEIVED